jgi:hypothetical protein
MGALREGVVKLDFKGLLTLLSKLCSSVKFPVGAKTIIRLSMRDIKKRTSIILGLIWPRLSDVIILRCVFFNK